MLIITNRGIKLAGQTLAKRFGQILAQGTNVWRLVGTNVGRGTNLAEIGEILAKIRPGLTNIGKIFTNRGDYVGINRGTNSGNEPWAKEQELLSINFIGIVQQLIDLCKPISTMGIG